MQIYDLIGIGFGPSNIALAIALQERQPRDGRIHSLFIERQTEFTWHPDMLLDGTHMQISFIKDLATLRNPTSRFTFISYLHEKQRLQDFINLKTFFPSRIEFNDYFTWAANQFRDQCSYGEEVTEILPEARGSEITLLRVISRDSGGRTHERLTRNLVVSIGGTANIPDCFEIAKHDPRIFHSHSYLRGIDRNGEARRIAVIGAGQSAAEIFMDLHGRPNAPQIDLVMRAHAIKPADDTPFVNEVFNVDYVDHVFSRSPQERRELLREFRHTNYASPDTDLIEQIFKILYQQRVQGQHRHRLLRRHEVKRAEVSDKNIRLTYNGTDTQRESSEEYDAVILATGYRRESHKSLLRHLVPHLEGFEVSRHYRLKSLPSFRPAIFVQGASEASHGLSDTLLSVTAVRTGEISEAILEAMQANQQHLAVGAV